jgi:hypothetical protein
MRAARPPSADAADVEEALRQLLSRVHVAQERLSEQVAQSACAEAAAQQETAYEEAGLSDPEQFYRDSDEGKEEKEGKAADGPAVSAVVPDSLLADGLERAQDVTGQQLKHK